MNSVSRSLKRVPAAPESTRPNGKRLPLALAVLAAAVAMEMIYAFLARFDAVNGNATYVFLAAFGLLFALYFASLLAVSRINSAPSRRFIWTIAAAAVAFRLTLMPAGLRPDLPAFESIRQDLAGDEVVFDPFLLYDQDVWRFLWEGRVAAKGEDPYVLPPQDEKLDPVVEGESSEVWKEIRERVTYPQLASVYPPAALAAFRLSHALFPGSILGWKFLMLAFEAIAIALTVATFARLGRNPAFVLVALAWNPLLIKTNAGSGHFEALLLAALALFAYFLVSGRPTLACVSLALATLTKMVPGILIFAVVPLRIRDAAAFCAALALGFLPIWGSLPSLMETMEEFSRHWRFNSWPFAGLEAVFGVGLAPLAYAFILAAVVVGFRRRLKSRLKANSTETSERLMESIQAMLWILGLAVILGPVVNPWYVAWLLPWAAGLGSQPWLAFSALVFLAFVIMVDGVEKSWSLALQYSAFVLLTLAISLKRRLQWFRWREI